MQVRLRRWLTSIHGGLPIAANPLIAAGVSSVLFLPGGWLILLILFPFYLVYRAHRLFMERLAAERRQSEEAARLHLATIEALARAIDAKEACSRNHPQRVQLYASRLCEGLGLGSEETLGIRIAALLHDIGKLAVPEHLLSKRQPLTNEEAEAVRLHARVGADILSGVPFTYPVASAILSHHERWDGGGYPHGLRGEAIPLGARILAVADGFDAIVSEGPTHDAVAMRDAIDILKREAGTAFDPQLVAAFGSLLPSMLAETAGEWRAHQGEPAPPSTSTYDQPTVGTDRVLQHIGEAHREVHALYEIAQSMSRSMSVGDTMALLSDRILKIVPWSACSLFLYERSPCALRCAFATGLDAPRLVDRTIAGAEHMADWLTGIRRTIVNGDPGRTFQAAGVQGSNQLRAEMSCPLYFGELFVGVLSVYHVEKERYSGDHRRLFERVAEQAGTALHNALSFAQTQEEALTDSLTGLPNRRWLGRYLPQELARAERPLTDVALLSIDIDGFKAINDVHGHEEGDRALRAVANALLSVCRPYDACARLSGDEFVVVLPECSRESADLRRAELQQRIGALELFAASGARLRIGASAGVAVFPYDARCGEELLDIADHRMYEDKTARRRRSLPTPQIEPWPDIAGESVPVRSRFARGG